MFSTILAVALRGRLSSAASPAPSRDEHRVPALGQPGGQRRAAGPRPDDDEVERRVGRVGPLVGMSGMVGRLGWV